MCTFWGLSPAEWYRSLPTALRSIFTSARLGHCQEMLLWFPAKTSSFRCSVLPQHRLCLIDGSCNKEPPGRFQDKLRSSRSSAGSASSTRTAARTPRARRRRPRASGAKSRRGGSKGERNTKGIQRGYRGIQRGVKGLFDLSTRLWGHQRLPRISQHPSEDT